MSGSQVAYSKEHPLLAQVKKAECLNGEGSGKETYHVVLDLKGSGLNYKTGDSFGILAENRSDIVQRVIKALNATGQEEVYYAKKEQSFTLEELLTKHLDLKRVSKKLLTKLGLEIGDFEAWDAIESNPSIELEELPQLLMPLLPRLYSVASSMEAVGEEVHFLVNVVNYELGGMKRFGVASDYLCKRSPGWVRTYCQESHAFTLTDQDAAPIIMVGPGTGVAPFRGFLQERERRGSSGLSWLFFGERNQATDFYYEDEFKAWEKAGYLKLTCAFSRDQEDKVYVQHRLKEHGDAIWRLLQEGAYFYVCGDAKKMAKDVETTLMEIAESHGVDGRGFIKELRKNGRYLRDIY